jgi:hypothetical protein
MGDEDDVLYQRETGRRSSVQRTAKAEHVYSTTDADDPDDETHIPDEQDVDK